MPTFDRSGDRSITPHPEARGGNRWNASVEYSILKCPDRLAPNDVSGVYRELDLAGWGKRKRAYCCPLWAR
jgi:hypothetical protein